MAGIAAKSYSDALFSLGQECAKLDVFKQQLTAIDAQLKEEPAFMQVLSHPKIHKDEKKKTLDAVFENEIDHLLLNFLKLLIDKSRFLCFHDIVKEFMKRYNEENNIVVAYAASAQELSDAEIQRLKEMLETKLNKTVEMRVRVDADLLAGVRIKIKDMVLDHTAKNRIENLKQLAQSSSVQES